MSVPKTRQTLIGLRRTRTDLEVKFLGRSANEANRNGKVGGCYSQHDEELVFRKEINLKKIGAIK